MPKDKRVRASSGPAKPKKLRKQLRKAEADLAKAQRKRDEAVARVQALGIIADEIRAQLAEAQPDEPATGETRPTLRAKTTPARKTTVSGKAAPAGKTTASPKSVPATKPSTAANSPATRKPAAKKPASAARKASPAARASAASAGKGPASKGQA